MKETIRSGRIILGTIESTLECYLWTARRGSKDAGVTGQGRDAAIALVLHAAGVSSRQFAIDVH
jgi:hypothetical protein